MTKVTGFLSAVIRRLIFIGFSAQIVFGIIWITKNIGYLQLYGDTAFYVTVSGTLKCDEYTGVLYPALLLIARGAGIVSFVPWYSLMYLFQLVTAFTAGFVLLKELDFFGGKIWRCIWGSLVFMTISPVMQINLAVLPNSLTMSLFVLEAAFFIKSYRLIKECDRPDEHTARIAVSISGVCLFWLLSAINEPVNMVIGLIPVIVIFVYYCIHLRKCPGRFGWVKAFVIIAVFAGLIVGINSLTQEKGLYGREEITVRKVLVNRLAWKSRFYRQASWLNEISDVVGYDDMEQTSKYQENVWLLIEPELEEKLGTDGANEVYDYLISACLDIDKKEVIHDMAIDMAAYCIPPVFVRLFIEPDSYITYTIRNYDIFKRNTPLLAKYYMDYSLLLFEVTLLLAAVLVILMIISAICRKIRKAENLQNTKCNEKAEKLQNTKCNGKAEKLQDTKYTWKKIRADYLMPLIVSAAMVFTAALFYMMRGSGVYDYKQGSLATVMWLALILKITDLSKTGDKA